MSANMISRDEIAAIVGPEFSGPEVTFQSVWETMKIQRVWRKETDFVPDRFLEFFDKLASPISSCPVVA